MLRTVRLASLAALAALGSAAPVSAQQSGRLGGTFAMTGHVTVAVHVKGEAAGQSVSRSWTFTPLCAVGPCSSVSLTRSRSAGSDTLTLTLGSSGQYTGSGSFYAPLRCSGRVQPKAELVPFTITVAITAVTQTLSGPVATAIDATYTNNARVNRTRCVALPSHDAAVYTGALVSGGRRRASRVKRRSPAGS